MILKYEWKKIVCSRINQIAMLVGYIIMAVTVIIPIRSEYANEYQKGITYQGIEAVKYEQQFAKDQTDYLTEEYLTGQLQKLQQMNLDLESDDGFLTAYDEFGSLFMYLMNSYSDIHNTQYEYDKLNELELSNGADFYEWRIKKLTDYLNLYHGDGNYNDAEKDYWISHAKRVNTPFKWGSTTVTEYYRTVLGLGFYLMLVIAVCIASVFAGENESGTADILLSSKNGRKKMIWAKVAASLLFSVCYVGIGYGLSCFGIYVLVGADGFDLPVQLFANEIPYSMTMGQLMLLQLLVSLAMIILTVGLILAISAVTRSSTVTSVSMFVLLGGPVFLKFTDNRIYNHILALTTVRLVDLKQLLCQFMDYRIGDHIVGLIPVSITMHFIVGILLILSCSSLWIRKTIH